MVAITGIILAAGAGTRIGRPKALLSTASGETWLSRADGMLRGAGCSRVVVVLGAQAADALSLVPSSCDVVIADRWEDGVSASLRAGLLAATGTAALVSLVDLPDLPVTVAQRVLEGAPPTPIRDDSLRQAVFGGRPGHPVLIGRAHWRRLGETLKGDRGARDYLRKHGAQLIECRDLADGLDVDRLG